MRRCRRQHKIGVAIPAPGNVAVKHSLQMLMTPMRDSPIIAAPFTVLTRTL